MVRKWSFCPSSPFLSGVVLPVLVLIPLIALALDSVTVTVTADSMADTLCPGDQVIAIGVGVLRPLRRLAVSALVRPGAIVLVAPPNLELDDPAATLIVKRVVATAGDNVLIKAGQLFVNTLPQSENYLRLRPEIERKHDWWPVEPDGLGVRPATVESDRYFLLGDNRSASDDSRQHGSYSKDSIVGLVVWVMHSGRREPNTNTSASRVTLRRGHTSQHCSTT